MTLLDLVCSTTWLVRPQMLEAIVALAARSEISAAAIAQAAHWSEDQQRLALEGLEARVPLQLVGARMTTKVDNTYGLQQRGPVAVLPVTGTITRYSNMFQSMSGGGATVETLARDFTRAVDDPTFSAILLNIDSPGGESNGIAEFSDMIYAARDIKPVVAYVSDLGASAAYWIATAASEIYLAETAGVGSIGCVALFRDPAADPSKNLEFVSSVSPNKRPDLATPEGKSQIQAIVDTLGNIFVATVARNRGITPEAVVSQYGGGGILIGEDAVLSKMAEGISSFEMVLADLVDRTTPVAPARPTRRAAQMSDTAPEEEAIVSVPQNPPAPTTQLAVATESSTDELARLRAQLSGAAAENARLRMSTYEVQGHAFAARVITEMRAFPTEEEHLVAMYVQAALDDENGPGLKGTLRTQLLVNAVAARTSVRHLTAEALGDTALQAIMARTAPPADASAAPTPERRAQLLSMSPLGRGAAAS